MLISSREGPAFYMARTQKMFVSCHDNITKFLTVRNLLSSN